MGSISKVMTTRLIVHWVDEGLFDVDVPVKQYVRDFIVPVSS